MNKIKTLAVLTIIPFLASCAGPKREFKSADTQNVIKWEKDENYFVKGVLSFGFYNTEDMAAALAKYPGTTMEDTVYYGLDDGTEAAKYQFHHDKECTPLLQFRRYFLESNAGDQSLDDSSEPLDLMGYLVNKHDNVQYWGLSENSKTYVAFTPYHIYKTGLDDNGNWTIQNKLPCKSIHVKSFTIKYNFYYYHQVVYSGERVDCATQEFTITDKTFNCGKEHGTIILGDNLPDPTTNSVKFGGTWGAGIRITEASGVFSLTHEDESLDTDENTKKEFVRSERKE